MERKYQSRRSFFHSIVSGLLWTILFVPKLSLLSYYFFLLPLLLRLNDQIGVVYLMQSNLYKENH